MCQISASTKRGPHLGTHSGAPRFKWRHSCITSCEAGVSPPAAGPPRRFNNEQANARAAAQEDRTPPCLPNTLHSPREDGWLWSGSCFGQEAQERQCFPRPTAADFAREHDQSGPGATTHQLWVCAFFEAPSTDQRHSVTLSCARPCSAVSTEG